MDEYPELALADEPMAEPLPVAPPPAPPQYQAPKKGGWREYGPLLALLPLAMKQGPAAVQGVLAGYASVQARKQQQAQSQYNTSRQQWADERVLYNDQQTAAQRQANIELQRQRIQEQSRQRMAQALQKLQEIAPDFASDDQARAGINAAIAQGLPAELVTNTVMQVATPTRIQRNRAQKALTDVFALAKNAGVENPAEFAKQMTWQDIVPGRNVTFDELLAMTGPTPASGAVQIPAKTKADDPVRSSLEVQAADALRRGDMVEYQRLLKVKREIGMADDRPPVPQTIVVQTVDQNGNPVVRVVPKVAGSEFATQPTATQQTAIAEQQTSLQQIGDIERLFKPEYVGPVVGRTNQAKMALPGTDVPEDVALFYSTVAAMRNEIIKLMSGAAVSGSEEQRMRDQLPQVTDKPSVFRAKIQQTKQNRERLLAAMTRRGQPQSGQAPSAAPGPNPFRR